MRSGASTWATPFISVASLNYRTIVVAGASIADCAGNATVARYRLTADEVLNCATTAESQGYGTVVLQAGEDPDLDAEWVGNLVRLIKYRTPMAVTLSLGEHGSRNWQTGVWRVPTVICCGSKPRTHVVQLDSPATSRPTGQPNRDPADIRDLGYEVGSGVMIGIPGQSWDDLADDLELMRTLDLDMIGVGPYIPHPETPMGRHVRRWRLPADRQVPADEPMTLKTIALARLLCPRANIPSTTVLATLNPAYGRERGLQCGANVIMPNVTPLVYRKAYEIYPNKAHRRLCAGLQSLRPLADRGDRPSGRTGPRRFAEPARPRLLCVFHAKRCSVMNNSLSIIKSPPVRLDQLHTSATGSRSGGLPARPGDWAIMPRILSLTTTWPACSRGPADRHQVRDVIAKSLDKQPLTVAEAAVLDGATEPDLIAEIFEAARAQEGRVRTTDRAFRAFVHRQPLRERLRVLRVPPVRSRGRSADARPGRGAQAGRGARRPRPQAADPRLRRAPRV